MLVHKAALILGQNERYRLSLVMRVPYLNVYRGVRVRNVKELPSRRNIGRQA